jgi:hypothetical protein
MDIKKVITSIPKSPLPIPKSMDAANHAFNNLVNAWKECSIVAEQEQTKRENIRAYRDINVKAIEESSATLKFYLENIFSERATVIQGMFDRLDEGLASGNMEVISLTIAAIVDVTKQSPLAAARELIANYHDPNVTMIEI